MRKMMTEETMRQILDFGGYLASKIYAETDVTDEEIAELVVNSFVDYCEENEIYTFIGRT